MAVPYLELKSEYAEAKKEIDGAIGGVFERSRFILDEEVSSFEREFAAYTGTKHCIGVGNGMDALRLALLAGGVKAGDEVLCVANSALASVLCASTIGAKPVFVDVEYETHNMDAAKIEAKITGKTKAIVPVHLYGQCSDMGPIMEIAQKHSLLVVEDACQAHGALYNGKKAGGIARIGCFSFYPTKNLGAYGDGGAAVTNDEEITQKISILRNYGQTNRYEHAIEGFNSRLDELQAAILRAKLKHLDRWNDKRREIAKLYGELIRNPGVLLPVEKEYAHHIYCIYALKCGQRDRLAEHLKKAGISTLIHYPIPAHLQKAYAHLGVGKGALPITEKTCAEELSLSMYPQLAQEKIREVADAVNSFR